MKYFFSSILLITSVFSYAQQYERIPDDNFRKALLEFFPDAFDAEGYMDITHHAITEAVDLNVYKRDITSLDGIGYFTGLKQLDCSENELNKLPDLPPLLEDLKCNNTRLLSLPVLPSGLQKLQCVYNFLTSLPELPSTLYFLNFAANRVALLPELPQGLYYLNGSSNKLIDLPALPPGLETLICSSNELTSLPPLPASLKTLDCNTNSLVVLPELPEGMTSLDAYNNCFEPVPVNPGHISAFKAAPNRPYCLVTALQTEKHSWTLYPNPVSDRLYLGEMLDHAEVYNAQGVLIGTYRKVEHISVADWPAGVYMLRSGESTSRIVRQ